jgi:3D (Asp-Asp-Asp) domain-containing protein
MWRPKTGGRDLHPTEKERSPAQVYSVSESSGGGRQLLSFRPLLSLLALIGILVFASCAAFHEIQPQHEQTLTVTATAYNSLSNQTDGNPKIAAWGDQIMPGMKAIAVSQDLLLLGLERGTRVRIHGLHGDYIVLDRMSSRWERRIDIYMGTDVKAARSWGKRQVKIFWTTTGETNP